MRIARLQRPSAEAAHLGRMHHDDKSKNNVFRMQNLGPEKEHRPFEALPDPRIPPFYRSKKRAFAMENLSLGQELRPFEASLRTCMPPPQAAQNHSGLNGEPES